MDDLNKSSYIYFELVSIIVGVPQGVLVHLNFNIDTQPLGAILRAHGI